MAYRVDIGSLRPAKKMPDGRLRVDGYLTRTGVFEYRNPDGSMRREYRPPQEVFRDDSMRTFAMAPVTDDHPPILITSKNAKTYTVGMIGESIRRDGDHLAGTIMVFDAATIDKMERGKVELSCGYECDLIKEKGKTPGGESYDAIQTNIRGNHIAIVHVGRAGSDIKVRMDSAIMQRQGEVTMGIKAKKNDLTLEEAASQVAASSSRADAAEAELAEAKARADRAEGELEGVRTRLTVLESSRSDEEDPVKLQAIIKALTAKISSMEQNRARFDADEPDRLRTAVRNRVKVESAAAAVLGGHQVFDTMDDRMLMVAVVEKLHGVSIPSEKSDDYVRARFDAAIEGFHAGAEALSQLQAVVHGKSKNEQDRGTSQSAREAMVERNRNAWQKKA